MVCIWPGIREKFIIIWNIWRHIVTYLLLQILIESKQFEIMEKYFILHLSLYNYTRGCIINYPTRNYQS